MQKGRNALEGKPSKLNQASVHKEIPTISKEVKQAEICLAVCMACHSAIPTVDHVGEIWRDGEGRLLSMSLEKT